MNVRTIRFDNTTSLVLKAQTWVLLPVNEGSKHWVGGHRGEDAIDGVLDSNSAVCGFIMIVRVNEMKKMGVVAARESRLAQEGIRRTKELPTIYLTQGN